jgi:CubicO group peptidase (beta-lactamase class C family)
LISTDSISTDSISTDKRLPPRSRHCFAPATLSFALCSTLALATLTSATALPDQVDELVRGEMERQQIPGLAVAVVTRQGIPVLKGYGLANVEHGVPVGTETIFQSGSVGKQFTAALVMTLVEEGKVALDQSIREHFPDAPASWQPITVRHLLSHTSGIPDYTTDDFDYRRDYTEDELARMAFALELEFPAGSRWNYSNTAYALLGFLARKVTGQFYGDLLEERIFAPLGMQTARVISERDIVPHRAAGYRLVDAELKNQEWVAPELNTTADGSLYLTILDLVRWDAGLRAGSILKPQSWAEAYAPIRLASGNSYPYGFGWAVDEVAGRARVHHGGAWQGFQSYISRFPDQEITILVLANLADADLGPIVDGVTRLIDATLVPSEPQSPPEPDPKVTARLEELLHAAAEGRLRREDFAYVRAGFFPGAARRYQELLQDAGDPLEARLVERRELGDDVLYGYEVRYPDTSFRVVLGLAPDGKVSAFGVRPKE